MDSKNLDNVLVYLYASITDIQSTIRVIDTKIAVVIGIIILPFTNLGKIYLNFAKVHKIVDCGNGQWLFWLLVGLFYVTWLAAFTAAIRAIMAIHNPARHVTSDKLPLGTFHNSGLYVVRMFDVFLTRKIKSKLSLKEYIETLPVSIDGIIEELAFEQMKLVYIRDMKSIRLRWAYLLLISWLILGFIGRFLYLYHCSK